MNMYINKELRKFLSKQQISALNSIANGEESQYAVDIAKKLTDTVTNMPKTYEQDGKGQKAIAYLHYFSGGNDWYITEKDMYPEQVQAFGVARLHDHDPELGYISITELIEHNVELDFHFEPTALESIN